MNRDGRWKEGRKEGRKEKEENRDRNLKKDRERGREGEKYKRRKKEERKRQRMERKNDDPRVEWLTRPFCFHQAKEGGGRMVGGRERKEKRSWNGPRGWKWKKRMVSEGGGTRWDSVAGEGTISENYVSPISKVENRSGRMGTGVIWNNRGKRESEIS